MTESETTVKVAKVNLILRSRNRAHAEGKGDMARAYNDAGQRLKAELIAAGHVLKSCPVGFITLEETE